MSKPAQKQADPPPTVLGGLRILVGRTRHQASALSAGLHASGAEIIEIPFIEVRPPRSYRPLDSALKKLSEYDWLILTSVNGVDAFFERLRKLRVSKSGLHNLKLAAIGPATKNAIEQQGLKVDVVPQDYIAESVVKSLRRCIGGKRVLLARARIARDVIPRELRKMGAHIDVVEAYQTVIPESSRRHLRAALEDPNRRPHVVTFTSSSSVRNFVTLLGGQKTSSRAQLLDEIRFASIGPVTSATLRDSGLTPHIEAKEYTIPGLIRAIQRSVGKEARRSTQLLVD
jgi:uroporphyrinogen-III synthase